MSHIDYIFRRISIVWSFGISVVLLLAAGWAVASGDSGDLDTFVTRLEPGDNLVGWTSHAAPVEALFEALPQVENVWTWDASWRRWEFASPRLPNRMWTLRTLTPGMGLRVRIGGEQAVDWERPRRPAQGTVRLVPGHNFVAWMGRDEAPLDRVVKGIGRNFERVGLWQTTQQWHSFYDLDAIETADTQPLVNFGEVLWVEVARSSYWLQPTGILPEVIIASQVSTSLEQEIWAAMRSTLDFYYERFGIEADFSRYRAYFPMTYEAYRRAQGLEVRDDEFAEAFDRIGGQFDPRDSSFFVRLPNWGNLVMPGTGVTWGLSTTVHEYTHAVQHQLSGGRSHFLHSIGPLWLSEGMAEWTEMSALHSAGVSQAKLTAEVNRSLVGEPPISDDISHSSVYTVGQAAALALAPDLLGDTLFDLYRAFAPIRLGLRLEQKMWPTWHAAFYETFEESVEEFYQRFERMRGGDGLSRQAVGSPQRRIELTVDDESEAWQRWRAILVNPSGEGVIGSDWLHLSVEFEAIALGGEDYVLAIELDNGSQRCLTFWTDSGLVGQFGLADTLTLNNDRVLSLQIDRSSHPCADVVEGRVLAKDGESLRGIYVVFHAQGSTPGYGKQGLPGSHLPAANTDSEGRFVFLVPANTQGRVEVKVTGTCGVSKDVSSASTSGDGTDAGIDGNRRGVEIEVTKDQCDEGISISGRVIDRCGVGVPSVWVYARREAGDRADGLTDWDGMFDIPVDKPGAYRLDAWSEGSRFFYRREGVAMLWGDATVVHVSKVDVAAIEFRLPADPASACGNLNEEGLKSAAAEPDREEATSAEVKPEARTAATINGWLLDHEGNGVANSRIYARLGTGERADVVTDFDGAFEIAIQLSGTYRLDVWPGGCRFFYQRDGIAMSWEDATVIQVSNADVTGIEFRLPEDPASFCN